MKQPATAIALVATVLPSQSAYFIQIITAHNILPLGIEMLRILPAAQDLLRRAALSKLWDTT